MGRKSRSWTLSELTLLRRGCVNYLKGDVGARKIIISHSLFFETKGQ